MDRKSYTIDYAIAKAAEEIYANVSLPVNYNEHKKVFLLCLNEKKNSDVDTFVLETVLDRDLFYEFVGPYIRCMREYNLNKDGIKKVLRGVYEDYSESGLDSIINRYMQASK